MVGIQQGGEEVGQVKIVRHFVLNYFWRQVTQDVVMEIVGVGDFFTHKEDLWSVKVR